MNLDQQLAVMRLYDGELPPAEVTLWRARLERDAECRAALQSYVAIGDAVREVAAVDGVRSGDIAGRVAVRLGRARAMRRGLFGVSAALALAAGLALFLRVAHGPVPLPSAAEVLSAPLSALRLPLGSAAAPALEQEPEADPSVAIEAIDFGAHGGTIFMVPSGATATPVVWVMDEPAPAEGRMEQL